MLMLAVQSLLLILAAFIAGAMIACFLRRVFFRRDNEHPTPAPSGGRGPKTQQKETGTTTTIEKTTETRTGSPTEASRFGRALTGTTSASVNAAVEAEASSDSVDIETASSVPTADVETVEPQPERGVVSTIEEDGDPSTTLASSSTAVDFTTQRISNTAPVAPDETENVSDASTVIVAGAVAGARGAAAAPPQLADTDDEEMEPPETSATKASSEPSSITHAAADVAMLRSVRSEALVGSDAPVSRSSDDNVFRLPTADTSDVDDLKRIRGIGVLIEKKLNAMGVRTYAQIANWTAGDVNRVSETLDFKGRIERESWIEQARILSSGGYTEFSRRG